LTNLIAHTFFFWGWEGYLFALCNIATAVVTWLFMRFFSRELGWPYQVRGPDTSRPAISSLQKSRRFEAAADRAIVLILLSFGLCIAMSVLGGLISAFIQIGVNPASIEVPLISAAMSDQKLPLILTEIMSRFPINIIDRLITAFAGYGFAVLIKQAIMFRVTNQK
jgi:hypothetical protein